MANGLNKYLHGSVWSWRQGERALIISNDEHNTQNESVICLTVSNAQGNAAVCIDAKNCIQCNQVHMIEKSALGKFEGAVSAPVLATAKAKLSALLNMNSDAGNLQPIRDTAARLVGQLAGMDIGYVMPAVEPVVADTSQEQLLVEKAVESEATVAPPEQKPTRKPKGKKAKAEKPKRARREPINYTDEDEAFVLDGNASADEIVQRFNLPTKKQAYSVRVYLKARRDKRQANQS